MKEDSAYRIFISYSHNDEALKDKIVKVLEANGLQPMHDEGFAFGEGFPDQIKDYIAHAHVFLPILTKESSGWVHQEIGYASALNIPVFPISHEQNPGQMIRDLHAVRWEDTEDWFDRNQKKLSFDVFKKRIEKAQKESKALYECAALQEKRTRTIINYAEKVIELGAYGLVRQIGALSSFHIPDDPISHPVWIERFGEFPVSENRCELQLKERLVLQKHADQCGCRIIVDPSLTYSKYGKPARISRLRKLLTFLDRMPKEKVEIAVKMDMDRAHNLLIVGNWFLAESKTAQQGKGYEQTNFTSHTPTVLARITWFDREFDSILRGQNIEPEESVEAARKKIKKLIEDLENQDDSPGGKDR